MRHINSSARRLAIVSALLTALLTACGGSASPESMVASAKEFLGKHDNKSAVIQLRNALQKSPDNGEARFLLGKAELALRDPSAEKDLRKALELGYDVEQVVPPLVRAMVAAGQAKKAIEEHATRKFNSPQAKAELQSALGDAYLAERELDKAHEAYQSALAAAPDMVSAKLGEARILAGKDDMNGSFALVDAVLAKDPKNLDALFLKADILRFKGKTQEADALYAQVIQSFPDNATAYSNRVLLALAAENNDQALTLVDAMKKALPQHYLTSYMEALTQLRRNELQKANDAILQTLKVAPGYLPASLIAGEIQFKLNLLPQAQTNLQAVLTKVPKHLGARRLLIATLLKQGQTSHALENLKPLLADAPNDPAVQQLAGEVYLANGELAEAEKYFLKVKEGNGQNAAVRTRLGQIHMAQGDSGTAFQDLQAASAMDNKNFQPDLMLVLGHLRRNELDQALQSLATLEKKLPQSGLPNYLHAAVAAAKQDNAGARKYLEQSIAVEPSYFPAVLSLARLDVQDKNWPSARKRFETVLEKDPKNVKALLALAEVLQASGATPDEIKAPLEKAVNANSTDPTPRLALIKFHLIQKNPKKAVDVGLEAQSVMPNNVDVLDALGTAQQAAGETTSAITTFQKAASANAQATQPLLRLAALYFQNKDNDAAIRTLQKALVVKPNLLEAQAALISVQVMAGHQADALAVAKEVQKQRPKEAVGFTLEADIYGQQKKWGEAAAALRQGLAASKNPRVAIGLHSALMNAGKNADAEKVAADWIKDNPKDMDVRGYLAERSLAAKQYEQAAAQYKVMLGIQPKSALVLNNLAWVAAELKDPKAQEYAEQANALAPNNPAILDTLGTILVNKGDGKRGLEMVRQANKLFPDNPNLQLSLARNLIKLGMKDDARKELEALKKLDEKVPARAEALELLKSL